MSKNANNRNTDKCPALYVRVGNRYYPVQSGRTVVMQSQYTPEVARMAKRPVRVTWREAYPNSFLRGLRMY